MSKSLNKSMLIGNLGADPEVRTIPSGARTATFSLATTRKWKNRETREEHEKTEWHRIVVWDGLVEVVEKYAHKGDRMYVEGSIEYRSYEDKDGVRKYITEIRARDIVLLGGKGEGGCWAARARAAARVRSRAGASSWARARAGAAAATTTTSARRRWRTTTTCRSKAAPAPAGAGFGPARRGVAHA